MTMIEGESEKEVKYKGKNKSSWVMKLKYGFNWNILRKIIAIRKTIYKAVGIGLVIGIIIALSIPKTIYCNSYSFSRNGKY